MTQDERFERCFCDIIERSHEMELKDTWRAVWHSALEPAELELNFEKQDGLPFKARTALGEYMYWNASDGWIAAYNGGEKYSPILLEKQQAIEWCHDHYRRAAIAMINKLTGCTE